MRLSRKHWILAALPALTILLDQVTKHVVDGRFRLNESLPIISGYFHLTYIRNTGAAFGLLANLDPLIRVPFFIIVPLVALGAIGYIFRKLPDNELRLSIALSLVVGGAVGNLIDRVFLGYVIDFLHFHWRYRYHFPMFNVADSAICVGVGILMIDLLLQTPEEEKSKGDQPDASASV